MPSEFVTREKLTKPSLVEMSSLEMNIHIHIAGLHASCQSRKNIKPQLLCCCFTKFILHTIPNMASFLSLIRSPLHGPVIWTRLSMTATCFHGGSFQETSSFQRQGAQSRASKQASSWGPSAATLVPSSGALTCHNLVLLSCE